MSWLKYARYLGYLSYVGQIIGAVTQYVCHKNATALAHQIAGTVYDAVDYGTNGKASKRVDRTNVENAVKGITDLYVDVLD